MYKTVILRKQPEQRIAWLILNRPEKLNTFNVELIEDIDKAPTEIEKDKETWILKIAKQCINQGLYSSFETRLEAESFGRLFSTKDFIEGVSAFLQKRKPKYSGE